MTVQPAGTRVEYTITWLEMTERPRFPYPHPPANVGVSLLKAKAPPVWYFLALYDAVGSDYAWEDIHDREHGDIARWLGHDEMELYTLMGAGWPQGFFLLDFRDPESCDLAYLGLVPEAVGRGLGSFLLQTAIHTAWDRPATRRLTVNTCTLDHPRALQTYQKNGFRPVRRSQHERVLRRARDLTRIPD